MSQGWICLHRKLLEHDLWTDEPFTKGQAWVDLLLNVNHKERDVWLGVEVFKVPVGGWITSEVKLSERWKWSRTKVRCFLDALRQCGMIELKKDTKKTSIIILNWERYQALIDEEEQPTLKKRATKEQQKNSEETTEEQQKDTNNNDNNSNNVNNENKEKASRREVAPHLFVSEVDEVRLLKKLHSPDELIYWYETVSRVAEQNPAAFAKKYKKHSKLILNWRTRKLEEGKVWDPVKKIYLKPFTPYYAGDPPKRPETWKPPPSGPPPTPAEIANFKDLVSKALPKVNLKT